MLGKFIKHCEDSLTATVFTHLLYLPTELFWQMLRNACYTDSLPQYPGEPLLVDSWPAWNSEGTNNSDRVIPDLFIRFADFDLIVEAKRWENGMQKRSQWQSELVAYANEYGEQKRPTEMIALGGIRTRQDDRLTHEWHSDGDRHLFECPVHMCRWEPLLHQCKRMRDELSGLDYPSSQTFATVRILEHLIDLFGWHGYSTGLWFADFNFVKHRLSPSITAHLDLFQKRSKQLSIP